MAIWGTCGSVGSSSVRTAIGHIPKYKGRDIYLALNISSMGTVPVLYCGLLCQLLPAWPLAFLQASQLVVCTLQPGAHPRIELWIFHVLFQ